MRRGVWFLFLEFAAFEREKMLLHIFRAESGELAKPSGIRPGKRKSPADAGVEDLNGRCRASLRDAEGEPFKPQTVLLRYEGPAGLVDLAIARHLLCLRSRTRRRPRPRFRAIRSVGVGDLCKVNLPTRI